MRSINEGGRLMTDMDIEDKEKLNSHFKFLVNDSLLKALKYCAKIDGISLGKFIRKAFRFYIKVNLEKYKVTIK